MRNLVKTPIYEAFESGMLGVVLYILAGTFFPAYSAFGAIALLVSGGNIATILLNYDKFEELLKTLNIQAGNKFPRVKGKSKTDYGYVYRLSVPPGISTEKFEKNKTEIEQFLNNRIKINYYNHNIFIEVYERELEELVLFEYSPLKGVEFPIGIEYGGRIKTVDLTNGEPHMIIAGETGCGKSTVLRTIITYLILNGVTLHLVDLKYGAEFSIFRNSKYVKSFVKSRKESYKLLLSLHAEVERRYNLFYDTDCIDIKEYNKKHKGNQLGYEILIIDEFADLQKEKECQELLEELAAKARACGLFIIISTQRPDSTVLNGRIKINCANVLGLKTKNELNSRIILDHGGLEDLRGKGHGILKHAGKEVEVQCYYLEADKARALIKHTNIDKSKKEQKLEIKDFKFMERL